MATDDLTSLFNTSSEESSIDLKLGRVISWDPSTGRNVVEVDGVPITDVKVATDLNVFTIQQDDLVGMFVLRSAGGFSQWWILGNIVTPGENATEIVVRGGSIAIEEHSLFVRGNGGITLQDGAILIAQYDTGSSALYFGRLVSDDSTPIGNGLMIRRRSGDAIAQVYGRDDGTAYVNLDADDIDLFADQIDLTASERIYLNSTILSQMLSDGQAGIGGTTGTYLLRQDGGAVTANVHMTTDGQILRVGSTERIKRDIQDFNPDLDAVLQLQPRSWLPGVVERVCPSWIHEQHTDPGDCHAGEEIDPPVDAPRQVGFIAEELDSIGLSEFVEYGDDGLPISILYDRLTAALLPVVQRQQAQITGLTDQLESLAARVAALEPITEEAP